MVYKKIHLFLASIILLSGCDWFHPREAEKPEEQESAWEEPLSPSLVLSNLEQAFEDRNIINYSASLFSDFEFFGDLSDSLYVNPGSFNDWYYNVEVEVATKIFNTFSSIELYFSDSLKDSTSTEAHFYSTYTMNLESIDSSVVAKGLAYFHLTPDSMNRWSIVTWKDFRTDSILIDWGIVKALSR